MKDNAETELLGEIKKKLDCIFGYLVVQNEDLDENAKVKILYDLGIEPTSIGAILGLSASAVMTRMSRIRKKGKTN